MLPPNTAQNITQSTNTGMVRPGSYNLASGAPMDVTYFNQYMMQATEFWDPFIQASLIKRPRHWFNMIPRGVWQNFSGLTGETRIFRGSLGHYAGLQAFDEIDPVPSNTNNPCTPGSFETTTPAWEQLNWKGYKRYWGTDPICAEQWQFTPEAITQLGWILKESAEYGVDIQEVWNRDYLIRTATVDSGRGYIMSKEFVGSTTPDRFYYDPMVKFGTASGQVNPATGITKPFIVFKAGIDVETLNFDMLGALKDELDVSCPENAIGSDGGLPVFGLPVARKDFDRYIKGNEFQVKAWRELPSRCEQLITGIKDVKTFEGWGLPWDGNQLRFKIKKVVPSYDSDDYGGVGDDLDGETVVIAEYVAPRKAGRMGENGIQIPEYNPEYGTAELAVAPVQMNKVFVNQFATDVASLGSGTSFGPAPGLNGSLKWINNPDMGTNLLGNKGFFLGAIKVRPRPEPGVVFSTAILYRRCTEAVKSRCPVDNADYNPDSSTGTTAEGVAYTASEPDAAADSFSLAATLDKTLLDTAVGRYVTVEFTGGGDPLVLQALVTKTSSAAKYEFHVMGSGVIDLVLLADAAEDKYHVTAGGKLAVTIDGVVTELVLGTVTAG